MAWNAEQADRCSGCGTFAWEWDENPRAYKAVSFMCLGCLQTTNERKSLSQRKSSAGMHVGLQRRGE